MTQFEPLLRQLSQPVTPQTEVDYETAAISLGQAGGIALPVIEQLLTASEADIRFWGVRSLWANGSEAAQARLINVLADADEMVRSGAALALGELQVIAAIPDLLTLLADDPTAAGDHAADALSKMGPPAAASLIPLLSDDRPHVRLRAAKALIPLESHAAIRPLIHCLDHDSSYLVRHYADQALKRMGVGEMIYFKP